MTEEDKGEFTCRVKNSQGTVTHSIELEVYSKYITASLNNNYV